MKKIVIAGGTGFLGRMLSEHFATRGYAVVILSRSKRDGGCLKRALMVSASSLTPSKEKLVSARTLTPSFTTASIAQSFVHWDGETLSDWQKHLEGATALINLCGKSVDCRYSEKNKQLIYSTRLNPTRVLGQAVSECENPPEIWLNSSSATIYRHAEDREMDEETGDIGTGFSVDVCQQWEKTFFASATPATKKISLRTAIVLGKSGGALQPLKGLARIGMGGKQGSGQQYFSWIHEVDFIRAVEFLIENNVQAGVYNICAPYPETNKWFMQHLRKAMNIPFGLPIPEWMLKIGARLIRTETELILKSRRVVPKKLMSEGFTFLFSRLDNALPDLAA